MKRCLLFLLPIIFSLNLVYSQRKQTTGSGDLLKTMLVDESGDRLNMEVDSLLVANYNKLIYKNIRSSGIRGYRIRIYSESGIGAKKEQQQVRAKFLSLYPGLDAYNRYDEPFFKVYVGDCRTRSEALKLRDSIEEDFPNSIIREDYINLKSAD